MCSQRAGEVGRGFQAHVGRGVASGLEFADPGLSDVAQFCEFDLAEAGLFAEFGELRCSFSHFMAPVACGIGLRRWFRRR